MKNLQSILGKIEKFASLRSNQLVMLLAILLAFYGNTLAYSWDLDNNGAFETSGQNVTFSAADMDGPSIKTVVLQVCDDKAGCATSTASVNVTTDTTGNYLLEVLPTKAITIPTTSPSPSLLLTEAPALNLTTTPVY